MSTITKARLEPGGPHMYSPMKIMITCEGDVTEKELYRYYTDEKSYCADTFVGMTYDKARERVLNDDQKYLLSEQRFMSF